MPAIAAAVLAIIPVIAIALPVGNALVYYPCDGNAEDASGNGHDGVVIGATPAADCEGVESHALSFDGGDWIDVQDHPDLTLGSDDFTMVASINISQAGGYYLMGHSTGPGEINKWIWFVSTGDVRFIIGPTPGWLNIGSFDFDLNVWYLVAMRREGNTLTALVDGQSIGSIDFPFAIADPSNTLQIGSAEYAANHPERRFRGKIGEVAIYKEVLSDAELQGMACDAVPTADRSWSRLKSLYR